MSDDKKQNRDTSQVIPDGAVRTTAPGLVHTVAPGLLRADTTVRVTDPSMITLVRSVPTMVHGSINTVVTYPNANYGVVTDSDRDRALALQKEITELHQRVETERRALETERTTSANHKASLAKLEQTVAELTKRQQLAFVLERVHPTAAAALLSRDSFRQRVLEATQEQLFVMSVDIRRSTELMLKARTPQAFADFITSLCNKLMTVVHDHYGIVDKFTGDGILAFFPEFFSGTDAGYLAVSAAEACHTTFSAHYRAHRKSFQSILKDVGLGIGIDFGECHLVQVAAGLTVVGAPVVYACRLGGAPAGSTLLNQPAFEVISERHSGLFFLNETTIDIKHEGTTVAYTAKPAHHDFAPSAPDWMKTSSEAG